MMSRDDKKNITGSFMELLILPCFIFAFFPVLQSLVTTWSNSDDYSHGFFVIPIILYIIWLKKERLRELPIQRSRLGLLMFAGSLILYIFAYYAGIKTASSLTLVSSVIGIVLFLYGFAVLRELSFPIFFMLFMIPVPEQIYASLTGPLQLLVSKISVYLAQLLDIPVLREGNVIHLPERTLEVVRACSGIRSLISLLTLSAVFAFFSLRSNLLRVMLFVSGVPAAIVVNVFRVFVMILAFYYFDIDLTTGTTHTVFGIIVFTLALLIVYLTKGMLALWDSPEKNQV